MPADEPHARLDIKENEPLKPYTTFKIGGPARYFVEVQSENELRQALAFRHAENLDLFLLGGGSNILVSDRGFDGFVVHMGSDGINIGEETADTVALRINAGETWDEVVGYAVRHGWWGIENLSHIPGQAGAALVQNVGAYGQQISDVLRSAEVMDIQTGILNSLALDDCEMGYRTTLFNTARKGRFIILNLTLLLARNGKPNLRYPDVKAFFEARGTSHPTLNEIRQAIVTIRNSKFPFPQEEKGGNAGSFFKNLLLSDPEYEALATNIRANFGRAEFARLKKIRNRFPTPDRIKIPTAFLMEICDLKGCQEGGARVNENQPLVLLNMGGATAADVLRLAKHIRRTIYCRTGMVISLEPELVGFTRSEIKAFMASGKEGKKLA